MFSEILDDSEPRMSSGQSTSRYPRRQVERKNYKELDFPDDDQFICKSLKHNIGYSIVESIVTPMNSNLYIFFEIQ